MRADPENRLARRARRSFGVWRDTRAAWSLTVTAWRQRPTVFAASLVLWAIVRLLCRHGLGHMHPEPGGTWSPWHIAALLALAITAYAGPLLLAACLWPVQHRIILASPPVSPPIAAARAARMLGAASLLALCATAILGLPLALAGLLLPAIGRVSTLLSLVLLLPAACLAVTWLLRLSFGLPAISLGLPRALAEGWEIGRQEVARALCVWLGAFLPLALVLAGCIAAQPNPLDTVQSLLRPVVDVLAVSLTGSLTGLFYRALRRPPALRPDVRPSWNASARREPVMS